MAVDNKILRLREILSSMGDALVAYSGGVDSTFLLRICRDVLGDRLLAITADSPIHPAEEVQGAASLARSLGVEHGFVHTSEWRNPRFKLNSPDRCYHCKKLLFESLKEMAAARGIGNVVEGSNLDDRDDYRPGARAANEMDVRRPLLEAGLTKAEIREFSRELGLPTWDKPSLPCLASRIPYGHPITPQALASIDAAEAFIRTMGIRQVRVRHYGHMARIEVDPEEIEKLAGQDSRRAIVEHLKGLGYRQVALDLAGYRMGGLNEEVLP